MSKKQKKALIRILIAAALTLGLHFVPAIPVGSRIPVLTQSDGAGGFVLSAWLLYLAPYLIAGYDVLLGAVHGIAGGQVFDENFLMAVATVGAMAVGDTAEAVAVMVFYQTGELFQSYAVGKSRKSISDLMDIRPDSACLETPEGEQTVDPDEVPVGSIIVVRPGERVPLDGIVEDGSSALNTSALTGESVPRDVSAGDSVISGCVNMTGLLRVRTTKPYGESTVSRILELVENSSMKKARSERFITRFARIYTPAVCGGALALAVLPPLALLLSGGAPQWSTWIYRALSFLVISCPCALVISIPLSFFGGIGGASARGILVKGSNDLETLARCSCVVFDKTGTLTEGVFRVQKACAAAGASEAEVLEQAALAEQYSNHPISRCLRESWGGDPAAHSVTDVQEIAGEGVAAQVDGHSVAAGNRKLMTRLGLQAEELEGGTQVFVARDGVYLGCVIIADQPKEGSKDAIAALKRRGVRKTVMLTGDREAAARPVAQALGIDQMFAGLLPQQKVEQVEALLQSQPKGESLAFVGDGVNDAPVLSRADVGVAMGAMGSDAAIEAADVVLMDDDPRKLPLAMAIARRTEGIVRQNIVFALAVKAVCLVLTALGKTNMWWAIFADVGVMVLAVLNATRALYTRDLEG